MSFPIFLSDNNLLRILTKTIVVETSRSEPALNSSNIFGFGISIELSISDLSGTNPPSSFLLDIKYFISGELSSGR